MENDGRRERARGLPRSSTVPSFAFSTTEFSTVERTPDRLSTRGESSGFCRSSFDVGYASGCFAGKVDCTNDDLIEPNDPLSTLFP